MGQGGRGSFSSACTRYRPRENFMDLDGDASSSGSSSSGEGDIVHLVSRLDTLVGIAIKYGVEVADIKKLNGLTTDIQMFARKSLRIPSPGRHPPSDHACIAGHSNADPQPRLGRYSFSDIGDSILCVKTEPKRKESAAMGLLRGYYGLPESKEGTEMEVYRADNGDQSEDEPFTPRDARPSRPKLPSSLSPVEPKLNSLNSMVSMAKDFVASEVEKAKDRMAVRRRPKGEAVDEEGERLIKSSVPRPRSAKLGVEVEVDCPPVRAAVVFNTGSRFSEASTFASGGGGRRKVVEELVFKLKKSSSTPNLQEEKSTTSKGDLSAILSSNINNNNNNIINVNNNSSSVTIPLLDTFTRRSKAALD